MLILKEMLPLLIPVILFVGGSIFAIYQLKLNAITQARIKWIENVRELLSSIINDINIVSTEYSDLDDDLIDKELSEEEFDKYEEEQERRVDELTKPYIHSADRKFFQLQLYLNNAHPDHIKLMNLINKFIDRALDEDEDAIKESTLLEQRIVDLSRKIIQEEWDKVFKANNLNPLY